jgi:hypothetical protein
LKEKKSSAIKIKNFDFFFFFFFFFFLGAPAHGHSRAIGKAAANFGATLGTQSLRACSDGGDPSRPACGANFRSSVAGVNVGAADDRIAGASTGDNVARGKERDAAPAACKAHGACDSWGLGIHRRECRDPGGEIPVQRGSETGIRARPRARCSDQIDGRFAGIRRAERQHKGSGN